MQGNMFEWGFMAFKQKWSYPYFPYSYPYSYYSLHEARALQASSRLKSVQCNFSNNYSIVLCTLKTRLNEIFGPL